MAPDLNRIYRDIISDVEKKLDTTLDRFRRAELGVVTVGRQRPHFLTFPGLEAKPFWQPNDFGDRFALALDEFTQSFPILREEFSRFISSEGAQAMESGFTGNFGKVHDWLTKGLISDSGDVEEEAQQSLPLLTKLLTDLGTHNMTTKSFLTLLQPGTSLAEHVGGTNFVLRLHLGMVIPEGDCRLKVDGVARGWKDGHWLCFDDTYEHAAWNNTSKDRWLLLLRALHPGTTEIERLAYRELSMHPNFAGLYQQFVQAHLR